MSEPQTTAAPTTEAAAPAAPVSTLDRGLAFLAEREKAKTAAQVPAEPAPEPEAQPAEATPAETAPAPTEAAKPPAEAKPKDDEDLRLAKAQQAALKKEREAFEAKQEAKREREAKAALEERLKALEAKQSKYSTMDPLEMLKERGLTYEDLTKQIVEGKLKPPSAEDLAREKLAAELGEVKQTATTELQTLKEELAAIKAEKEQLAKQQQLEATQRQLQDELKQNAEAFPVLSAMPWAAQQIMAVAEKNSISYAEAAKSIEDGALSDLRHATNSDSVLKALLTEKATQDRVLSILAELGVKPPSAGPASDKGDNGKSKGAPAAIPQSKALDSGTRTRTVVPKSTEDRIKAGLEMLAQRRR